MRRVATTAVLSVVLILLSIGGALSLVIEAERGPTPPIARAHARSEPSADGVLDFAGSGSNAPLTEILLEAYSSRHPDVRMHLHEGIGSTGAIRAVADGAIDVGLVSRRLTPEESAGLLVVPYARVEVVLGAHPSVTTARMTRRELVDLYAGRPMPASLPRIVIQRERGDSSHRAVERVLDGFLAANDRAWTASLHRVVYSDESMIQALLETPGATGLVDRGRLVAARLPLHVIEIEGLDAEKELAFLVRGGDPRFEAFAEFCRSEEARALVIASGYLDVRDP
jgi:phosphate transport system substrate-binding protein